MQRFRLLSLGLGLLAGTASAAEEAHLTYHFNALQGPPVYTMGQKLKTGTSPPTKLLKEPRYHSPKPIYGTAAFGTMGRTVFTFVLDESRGAGQGYDRLYVDANRNGDLTDDRPLRGTHRRGAVVFGPLALLIDVDGRKRLYHAMLEGREGGPATEYFIKSLGYYAGRTRFGAKRHSVALVDFNGNGLFGDPFRDLSFDPGKSGDMILVDANGDGRFEQGGIIPKETLYCGKCIVVDGRFYELATRSDGSALRVTPAPVKLAAVRSDYPRFALILVNEHGVLPIESQGGVARVPVGTYRVAGWSIEHRAGGRKWEVQGGGGQPEGSAPELAVTEGGSPSFKLSSPLVAKVADTRTSGQGIDFQLEVTTASGERIGNVAVDGQQPPEPTLKIVDARGNEVATLKFHYG
jgi:hypothetical protein